MPFDEHVLTQEMDAYLRQMLSHKGAPLTFAEWMSTVLYAPRLGYYHHAKPKFGPRGDFITAPNYSPLFGQCLATQIIEILDGLPQKNILEMGPGNGVLAKTILDYCSCIQYPLDGYYLIETSPSLQHMQQTLLASSDTRCHWVDTIPADFTGVIIANEVIDALPAERFCILTQDQYYYEGITCDEMGWHWQSIEIPSAHQAQFQQLIQRNAQCFHNLPYRSEYRPDLGPWFQHVFQPIKQGVVLILDYGYREVEYYHPERNRGSLACFYQHTQHDNPLIHLGLQDISVHVNFTALADAAMISGFELAGFCTQANFLINTGLLDRFDPTMDSPETVQKLIHPAEMGERVKVMALSKDWTESLRGFGGRQCLL